LTDAESTPDAPGQVAVTVASDVVTRAIAAAPDSSVVAVGVDREPADVANATGTPAIGLPYRSSTLTETAAVPPDAEST
jgi:hypothetical protein